MTWRSIWKSNWAVLKPLSLYERFEQAVCLLLTLLIAIVICVAVVHMTMQILSQDMLKEIDPANQTTFQTIFGMIMTVLIALEFKHSVLAVLKRRHNIVQVRTVVLIALLALVRKFIILDRWKQNQCQSLALLSSCSHLVRSIG